MPNESIEMETMTEITDELNDKIEIATQTLDRNIGFVVACDNKTSVVLATVGVLLTIILTNEGLNEILRIAKCCTNDKNFCNIFYLICLGGAAVILGMGIFNLGRVLVAKTSEESIGRKEATSRIFFTGIRKNGDYKTYNQRFRTMSKEDLLNDLIEQIYINADIATTKYKTYNVGLKYTVVGFILFVVLLLVGIYIY